jgi:hypothetical protein
MSRLPVRRFGVLLAVLLLVAIPVLVSAGATYDPVQGPTVVGSAYQWRVKVTAMSNPDKVVCFSYAVRPAVAPNWTATSGCTCVGTGCSGGVGDWTCTLAQATVGASTFDWDVASWSAGGGGTCGGRKTPMGAGTVTPSSVSLRSFTGRNLPITGIVALGGVGLLAIGGVTARMRRMRR